MNETLKRIRAEKKLTQNEIAKEIGIERAAYTNIENGKRTPSVNVAKRIAAFLGFDWTLFFENETKNENP